MILSQWFIRMVCSAIMIKSDILGHSICNKYPYSIFFVYHVASQNLTWQKEVNLSYVEWSDLQWANDGQVAVFVGRVQRKTFMKNKYCEKNTFSVVVRCRAEKNTVTTNYPPTPGCCSPKLEWGTETNQLCKYSSF